MKNGTKLDRKRKSARRTSKCLQCGKPAKDKSGLCYEHRPRYGKQKYKL